MKQTDYFKGLSNIDSLLEYLENKGRAHKCYYHYTSWDSFSKIYNGASFLLTKGNSLTINDQHEALMKGAWEEWNRLYIGSFAYGSAENMAMWGLYGLPWEDAVRIAIPKKAMLQWIDNINEVSLWNNGIVATIPTNGCLSDIVYVSGASNQNRLQLTHRDATFETINRQGLHGIDKDCRMTGHIKNYAWRYENEVRLLIRLPYSTGYEKIMVKIPEEVLNEIKVTTGPSFLYKNDDLYKMLQKEGKIESSGFEGLVRYRPLCNLCQNGPFVRNG